MTRKRHRAMGGGILAVTLMASVCTVAPASEPPEGGARSQANVLLLVRIGRIEDGHRTPVKSYTLVVADGSPGSRLLAGARVPFPTEIREGSEGSPSEDGGMSFVYQNIGFTTNAQAWIVGEEQVRLTATIEDSRVVPGPQGLPASVETRQMSVNAVLTDGIPLELTRAEGPSDRSGFVEIEAKILR